MIIQQRMKQALGQEGPLASIEIKDGKRCEIYLLSHPSFAEDEGVLQRIQEPLFKIWQYEAPANLEAMKRFVTNFGGTTFVAVVEHEPKAVLWTTRISAGGNPGRLLRKYKSFNALAWHSRGRRFDEIRGDTAALLAITALTDEPGFGRTIRDGVFGLLPANVKWALTVTPVGESFDPANPATYSDGATFHTRGRASATIVEHDYRLPNPCQDHLDEGHLTSVCFFRYDLEQLRTAGVTDRPPLRPPAILPLSA